MSRIVALAPFRVRNFRFQWPADVLASLALEMELLILGWYMLTETGSVVMLTSFAALYNVGTLVAPMFGVVGDRIGQRNLLIAMRAIYFVLSSTLCVLAFSAALNPFYVFIIAALVGLVRPSDIGVRSALVAVTVPHDLLVGAMSFSRTTQDFARIVGALTGAGLFVAYGIGPAYVAIASFYALSVLLLFGVGQLGAPEQAETPPISSARPSPWRDLREGLSYILKTPRLRTGMWIAFIVNLTAFPLVTGLMPYIAKELYHVDQTGLGYLVASLALGALIGSIILSLSNERMRVERVMVGTIVTWYAALLVFAHVRSMAGGMACLFVVGLAQSMSMVSLAVVLMRTAAPQFRGRVMGVRMLAIYGHPLGLLAAGALIEHIGFTATAMTYGAVGLAATLAMVMYWRADVWHAPELTKA